MLPGWSFLGGSLGTDTPCHISSSALHARQILPHAAPAHQEIRSETLWKKAWVLTRQKIQALPNIRPTVQKENKPPSTPQVWGCSPGEDFSPRKDQYLGVKKESCHSSRASSQSGALHFQLQRAAVDWCLCNGSGTSFSGGGCGTIWCLLNNESWSELGSRNSEFLPCVASSRTSSKV